MGDFDSDLQERLRRLVSTEEPSKGWREGVEAQLRLSDSVVSAGSRTRALAAVAVALVIAASVVVLRQVSDGGQRVVVGGAAPATTAGSTSGSASPGSPGTTRVMTANATATAGLATATLQLLQSAGYVGTRAIDAFRPSDTSRVYFAPGYEADARAVARLLGLGESAVDPTEAPVAQPTGADLVVVVGQDLAGMRAAGPPTTRGDLPARRRAGGRGRRRRRSPRELQVMAGPGRCPSEGPPTTFASGWSWRRGVRRGPAAVPAARVASRRRTRIAPCFTMKCGRRRSSSAGCRRGRLQSSSSRPHPWAPDSRSSRAPAAPTTSSNFRIEPNPRQ